MSVGLAGLAGLAGLVGLSREENVGGYWKRWEEVGGGEKSLEEGDLQTGLQSRVFIRVMLLPQYRCTAAARTQT